LNARLDRIPAANKNTSSDSENTNANQDERDARRWRGFCYNTNIGVRVATDKEIHRQKIPYERRADQSDAEKNNYGTCETFHVLPNGYANRRPSA